MSIWLILDDPKLAVVGASRASTAAAAAAEYGTDVDHTYEYDGIPATRYDVTNDQGQITVVAADPVVPDDDPKLDRITLLREKVENDTATAVDMIEVLQVLGLYRGTLPTDNAPRTRLEELRAKIVADTITDAELKEAVKLLIAPDSP